MTTLVICARASCEHLSSDHAAGHGKCLIKGCKCHAVSRAKVHTMTPTPLVSIMNLSAILVDADVARMVSAVGKQLAKDVAPFYGIVPALEHVLKGGMPTPGSTPCYLIDDPDVDGALGYHDVDDNGNAYIKVFVRPTLDNGGTVLSGAESVSVTLSHELIELVGDEDANAWRDAPDGLDYAQELCDAVEGDTYEIDGVSVSNFVLPAFFKRKPAPKARLDYLGKLAAPFTMTAGGYQIRRTEPGRVSEVFARHLEAHPMHACESPHDGVAVLFGATFPSWKRKYKSRKARARGRKAVA